MKINVTCKGVEYKCEFIDSARLSTGVMVQLFRVLSSPDMHTRFLVGVRRIHRGKHTADDALHFFRFIEFRNAVSIFVKISKHL